jgi:hypothetical protein
MVWSFVFSSGGRNADLGLNLVTSSVEELVFCNLLAGLFFSYRIGNGYRVTGYSSNPKRNSGR